MMKQAVMPTPGAVQLREICIPAPEEGQVQIAVKRIGVCGSDVHVWHGKHPLTPYPVVQGHEFCGVISNVGPGVDSSIVGKLATALPQEVCGDCVPCRRGRWHVCDELKVRGFQAPGCAQEYFVTEFDKVIVLPDSFTYEQGALIEPIAVASHSTSRAGNLDGMNVVVLGAGPIGNLIAQTAKAKSANMLIADVSPYRLMIAEKCGIKATFDPNRTDLATAVREVFGTAGVDVVFDCAGVQQTLDSAVSCVNKGGTVLIVAVFSEKPRIDMSVVCESELTVTGTMMYHHDDYRAAVELIRSGALVTAPLESKHFTLDQYETAYRFIDAKGAESMKVFIDI